MAIEFGVHRISNVAISSSMGHAGRGLFPYTFWPSHRRMVRIVKETKTTSLTKSSTNDSRVGKYRRRNPFTWPKYVKRIPGSKTGLWNNYALDNLGTAVHAKEIFESCRMGYRPVPNTYPEFDIGEELAIQKIIRSGHTFQQKLGRYFWAWELSYSCTNSGEIIEKNIGHAARCTYEIKKIFPWLFIIVKGSFVHPFEFWEEQERAGADAAHGINTIHHNIVYPPGITPSPFKNIDDGAISGGPIKEIAFAYNKELGKRVKIFKLFGGGVETLDDVHYYQDCGADVVVFCSAFIRTPKEAEKILVTMNK